jgi:hypothetical protein
MMQERKYQNGIWTKEDINDDLIWNVPIYDVVNRRYAAFSSLLEAIHCVDKDPKGNGVYFKNVHENISHFNFVALCYLFRLCGSGINYIPKTNDTPYGSHGFGNFWVIEEFIKERYNYQEWIENIPENKFCDVKGYLLPMIKGGLRNFIQFRAIDLVTHLWEFIIDYKYGLIPIKMVVDEGNNWLIENGYKRQNFVLTAFAMDMAEYYPNYVDQDSDVYLGTNAKKCLKLILPDMKSDEAIRYLCDLTGNNSKPYDMEDVACDFIRYLDNFQSEDHIKMNKGVKYYNNVSK